MNTLNQIITGLNKIATAHKQINSFGFGDIWEFAASGTTSFPTMWVELDKTQLKRRETEYTFNIYLMDLVLNGEENETEVLSDMIVIAKDLQGELTHPDWTWVFEATEDISLEDFSEKTDEYLTGVKMNIKIRLSVPYDRCAIPETSITRT